MADNFSDSIEQLLSDMNSENNVTAKGGADMAQPIVAGNTMKVAAPTQTAQIPQAQPTASTTEEQQVTQTKAQPAAPETFKSVPKLHGLKGVAGMRMLKDTLKKEFIMPLQDKTVFMKYKVAIPNGILFYGPPGCGKTYIVEKLAEEVNLPLIKKSVADFGSSYVHQTAINIRKVFDDAKKSEPCILFLDEIDALVSSRDNNTEDSKLEEISQFLQELNNLTDGHDIIIVAATNRPDQLDDAIKRAGRFDKKIYIGPPDDAARKEMFRMFTHGIGRPTDPHIDYDKLASLTDGYSSSDIEAICDTVARKAAIRSKKDPSAKLNMRDFEATIESTPSSLASVDMTLFEHV